MSVLLKEYGTVPEWGIPQDENEALLLTSVDIDNSVTVEHVQKNRYGQTIGWLGIDQEASFSMSGSLLKGKTAADAGYTLGEQVALNNFALGSAFSSAMGAGGSTAIIKNYKTSFGNESAVQVDLSGVCYAFGASEPGE